MAQQFASPASRACACARGAADAAMLLRSKMKSRVCKACMLPAAAVLPWQAPHAAKEAEPRPWLCESARSDHFAILCPTLCEAAKICTTLYVTTLYVCWGMLLIS